MKAPIEIGKKFREKIAKQYPPLDKAEIPENNTRRISEYKKLAIKEYHVIFWHRLLQTIYDMPLEIECEIQDKTTTQNTNVKMVLLRKTDEMNNWEAIGIDKTTAIEIQAGKTKPSPVNWKYLVRLPSGGIVELATKDNTTIFYIAQIVVPERDINIDSRETKKFINQLLEEANRLKAQLFNPTKEFERQEGIRLYLLVNVYLSNYLSAKALLGTAEVLEKELQYEFLRYDARTPDLYDEEKRKHIDQHMLMCGMYYCSVISYFFMALEGFVNLVFHIFLKKKFRDREFRADQRFDLEQKLRLMSILCDGFNENSDLPTTVISDFIKLKNYRNSLFHSKIEDSLKSLSFFEKGFYYNYNMSEYKDHFLPVHRIKLTVQDVIEVNKLVDHIVNCILESMNKATRNTTETYILKKPQIPIIVMKTGELAVGESSR